MVTDLAGRAHHWSLKLECINEWERDKITHYILFAKARKDAENSDSKVQQQPHETAGHYKLRLNGIP